MNYYVFILSFILFFVQVNSNQMLFRRLNRTIHENEAISIIKEAIYNQEKVESTDVLELMSSRNWIKSSRLIIDFLLERHTEKSKKGISNTIDNLNNLVQNLKSLLDGKKKNIVKLSPLFQWSQDEKWIRIRIKFARNIDSPGEKDIENFKVNVTTTHLTVNGYKNHDDYLVWYHREIQTFDNIRTWTFQHYKEDDGAYIVKFEKSQGTLYWGFLDQPSDSHDKIITWMDMFEKFEDRKQYFQKVEEIYSNAEAFDVENNRKMKVTEKRKRLDKISKIEKFLKNKNMQNKNFCNSPVDMKFCVIPQPDEWAYWLL